MGRDRRQDLVTFAALAALAVAGTPGCGASKAGQPAGAASRPAAATQPGSAPAPGSGGGASGACQMDFACPARAGCIDGRCQPLSASMPSCQQASIEFDPAAAWVSWDELESVRRMARCLAADGALRVTVTGYPDERGAAAGSRALARRRAEVVADQLWVNGVARDRIRVVGDGAKGEKRRVRLTTSRE